MKRIYLAGPMTGHDNENSAAFNAEAARLRALGYIVCNPAEINEAFPNRPYVWYMKYDIGQMVTCDAVALLPNWYSSRGTNIEYRLARDLELPTIDAASIVVGPVNVGI
jgi:nucleoside 2-deoxyribosyltransferase